MEMNEIRERLTAAEQSIHRVVAACQQDASTPPSLKQCIEAMDEHSIHHKQLFQTAQDEPGVREYVETLEELGDRAKQACEEAGNVSPELRNAVQQAHEELSSLKHELH